MLTFVLVKSVDTINLGSSVKIFEEKPNSVIKHNNFNTSDINECDFPNGVDNLLLENNEEKMVIDAGTDSSEKYVQYNLKVSFSFCSCTYVSYTT